MNVVLGVGVSQRAARTERTKRQRNAKATPIQSNPHAKKKKKKNAAGVLFIMQCRTFMSHLSWIELNPCMYTNRSFVTFALAYLTLCQGFLESHQGPPMEESTPSWTAFAPTVSASRPRHLQPSGTRCVLPSATAAAFGAASRLQEVPPVQY